MDNNVKAFLELVKTGLWEKEVQQSSYGDVDWETIYRLAEEQSVLGLVTADLEHVIDVNEPQTVKLQFVGSTLQIEQRNKEMNEFVGKLTKKLHDGGVDSLVVKGQGVAQCYNRQLWRTSGDVDLLMDAANYEKAKGVLFPIAYDIQNEDKIKKHQTLKIMGIDVDALWIVLQDR